MACTASEDPNDHKMSALRSVSYIETVSGQVSIRYTCAPYSILWAHLVEASPAMQGILALPY
jgi:hypothetical protein